MSHFWGMAHHGYRGDAPRKSESRLLRRVAQISGGKVFGGHRFVMEVTSSVGREYGGGKGARPVEDWAYSSHGYRLAARVDAA